MTKTRLTFLIIILFSFSHEDLSGLNPLKQSMDHHSSVISSANLTPSIAYDYLPPFDVSNACGPNLIPAYLLKCCAEEIS